MVDFFAHTTDAHFDNLIHTTAAPPYTPEATGGLFASTPETINYEPLSNHLPEIKKHIEIQDGKPVLKAKSSIAQKNALLKRGALDAAAGPLSDQRISTLEKFHQENTATLGDINTRMEKIFGAMDPTVEGLRTQAGKTRDSYINLIDTYQNSHGEVLSIPSGGTFSHDATTGAVTANFGADKTFTLGTINKDGTFEANHSGIDSARQAVNSGHSEFNTKLDARAAALRDELKGTPEIFAAAEQEMHQSSAAFGKQPPEKPIISAALAGTAAKGSFFGNQYGKIKDNLGAARSGKPMKVAQTLLMGLGVGKGLYDIAQGLTASDQSLEEQGSSRFAKVTYGLAEAGIGLAIGAIGGSKGQANHPAR